MSASFTVKLPFSAAYESVRVPSSLEGSVSDDAFSLLMRAIADENKRTNGRLDELEGKTAVLERRADNLTDKIVLRRQYELEISCLNAQVASLSEMNEALTKRLDDAERMIADAERMIAVLGLALTPS